jgi:hypothetical protein
MISSGVSYSGTQASVAVFNVDAPIKAPQKARDDVVAPIDTASSDASKTDISLLKMNHPSLGQNLNLKV